MVPSTLSFTLSTPLPPSTRFGPRLGILCLKRPNIGPDPHINVNNADVELKIDTPGLLIPTSRGVVPHLSRDHFRVTNAIKLVNVPFESL
jgi:queuine tRNA-ribosyltransferase